ASLPDLGHSLAGTARAIAGGARGDPGCAGARRHRRGRRARHRAHHQPQGGRAQSHGEDRMRLVDLSHPWNMHTPGWVGYPGSKIYYTQTLQTNRIVSQRVETSLHVGTHLDGPMHAADGAGDIASLPLTKLVHEGVIVDVSDAV